MFLALLLLIAGWADEPAKPETRTEVKIEKQAAGKPVPMSPQHVYASGDMIRIRFRTNSDGFLYVVNRDTKNQLTVLFPRDETGRDNQVHAGTEYVIPSTADGWFRIQGEPGYDTAYFVLSPTDLTMPGKPTASETTRTPLTAEPPLSTLRPRCDDALFRSRGECMDSDSGARGLAPAEKVPTGVTSDGKMISRDLTFIRKPDSTVILAKPSTDSYVVYEFRIPHQ